jgi:pyroglutamyl-peptidase
VSDVILVTGFEPYAEHRANPSMDVAKALDGRRVGANVVRAAVLPVHHVEAAWRVVGLLDEHEPRAVVHLGLAPGRFRIALERVAVNVMDFPLPDAGGYVAHDEPCVTDGPAAYFSTLPLATILEALVAEGIPAYVSNTAGTYLCNQTLYSTLHALAERGSTIPAGFVHLPLLPAMVAASGLEQPSMDASLMVRAVEIALGVVAHAP